MSPKVVVSSRSLQILVPYLGKNSTPSWWRLLQPSGKAATSWTLNISVSPKVVVCRSLQVLVQYLGKKTRRLPDEDCYSHQVKLLPAGRWTFLLSRSLQILASVLGRGKTRRLPDEDCYSHQVKLLPAGRWTFLLSRSLQILVSTSVLGGKNSTPSWWRLLQPSGKAATSWALNISFVQILANFGSVLGGKNSTPSWWRLLQPSGKAATSWALNISFVQILANFDSILGEKNRRLPDEDCYSHQVKLLPAGRWTFLLSRSLQILVQYLGEKLDAFLMKTATAIR